MSNSAARTLGQDRANLYQEIIERGFSGQNWLIFRQALALGAHVRKGGRGTTVVYAYRLVLDDERRPAEEEG